MKRFILKVLLYSAPIIIPILAFLCFINPYLHGDMGVLGYITFPIDYGKYNDYVENKVINCGYDNVFDDSCIFVIGDSFSQTKGNVISYTHYLAEDLENVVVNLYQEWYKNPLDRFLYMSKTQNLPRIVIVEMVERMFVSHVMNMDLSLSAEKMLEIQKVDTTAEYKSTSKTLLEKVQEWSKREMSIMGFESPIKECILSKPCFTCQDKEQHLYFYMDDIQNTNVNDSLIDIVIRKMDDLFCYSKALGVELYILIAADKYDVYQDYILDNVYPAQNILDDFSARYNNSYLINSKDTLSQMVANDIKDVYWCNDTHWSPIGSKAVARQIINIIDKER